MFLLTIICRVTAVAEQEVLRPRQRRRAHGGGHAGAGFLVEGNSTALVVAAASCTIQQVASCAVFVRESSVYDAVDLG